MNFSQTQKGFTLVEMMVVIAIIAILAAMSYPSYLKYIQRARLDNARTALTDAAQFMERYYAQHNTFCEDESCTKKPTLTWVSKSGNSTVTGNVILADTDYYDYELKSASANSFVLQAHPKAGLYDATTLANIPLHLQYDSTNATFARCTENGLKNSENASAPDSQGCEVFQ